VDGAAGDGQAMLQPMRRATVQAAGAADFDALPEPDDDPDDELDDPDEELEDEPDDESDEDDEDVSAGFDELSDDDPFEDPLDPFGDVRLSVR
jgi:hypothetical protein